MSVFLPLLDDREDPALLDALARIGPIILPPSALDLTPLPDAATRYLLLDNDSSCSLDEIAAWLDHGADKVILPLACAKEAIGIFPADRLLLLLDVANVSAVTDKIRSGVSGVLIKTPTLSIDFLDAVSRFFSGSAVHVLCTATNVTPSQPTIRGLLAAGAILVLPTSLLTLSPTSQQQINVADAFLSPIVSDREDGLFPTVVSSHLEGGRSLGLVYSSPESLKESILTGQGVYQSRKHGLWRKGETSGATQDVISIRLDCDSDSLEFRVIQHGAGFCHLNRSSCFGESGGLSALERTLQSRLSSAPEGSYTRKLFEDPVLLRAKIMEEADELCRAETKEEVAFEAADLLYFALAKCVAAGVGIADIERSLDEKAKKVTRRPGNAKPQWTMPTLPQDGEAAQQPLPTVLIQKAAPHVNGPIRMRTFDLAMTHPAERARLLRRPVLRSDEMILKVKPIVDDVRVRGDTALLELTAKLDKAQLTSTVICPPFPSESMLLDSTVRDAIDVAYANIRKFHAAQAEQSTMVVETMPGVVCSRFARPIARVGLYVPGGTAVLPSTALMLGIPAQVAGCKEIIIATPPRPDGSISPEVMYVAHLVGASTVLKAGGAQAVAAMAYGTATVPKVDKIFGPGNQWVTAAKMLVQNDTDAMVSIDMPAGPSEVLVIADGTCNPAFVAADLLSQAEHGIDSQVVLVSVNLSDERLAAIEEEVDVQAHALPRVDIVRESVAKSIIVKARSAEEAIEFSNDYAPEHLILHIEDASARIALVENAGSVFVGPFSPESCGDYASGTNHTLPTNGYARQFSGVNTLSFQKHITSQEVTADGLKGLGPVVATLADCEGLQAHANAVRIRLRHLREKV
ncbi:histidine biosynthesis trifunctional-protein [Amylocystis lapponica]|nr:histidine biosynthesis trifunctional-protein [Amylocystis lapponica]